MTGSLGGVGAAVSGGVLTAFSDGRTSGDLLFVWVATAGSFFVFRTMKPPISKTIPAEMAITITGDVAGGAVFGSGIYALGFPASVADFLVFTTPGVDISFRPRGVTGAVDTFRQFAH